MKLFFDEDTGKGVPEALRALELPDTRVEYVRRLFRKRIQRGEFPDGVKDEDWIPFAGRGGWLVLSCNKWILEAEAQRELWIRENVGGVFFTSGQEKKRDLVMWILKRWEWLQTIDTHETRPFAYLTSLTGRPRRDPRVPPATLFPASTG